MSIKVRKELCNKELCDIPLKPHYLSQNENLLQSHRPIIFLPFCHPSTCPVCSPIMTYECVPTPDISFESLPVPTTGRQVKIM